MKLRREVLAHLVLRGVEPKPEETAQTLKERLNDLYLEDVRRLRERQRKGEIPLRDYASHAERLKQSYPLLGLPLELWLE